MLWPAALAGEGGEAFPLPFFGSPNDTYLTPHVHA